MPAHDFAYLDASVLARFGEPITYFPKEGESRSIVAAIDESSQVVDEGAGLWRVEILTVFVLRDESDATYGGIEKPQIGDGIRRATDPPDKTFAFYGPGTDTSNSGHVWEFDHRTPLERGGNRLPR